MPAVQPSAWIVSVSLGPVGSVCNIQHSWGQPRKMKEKCGGTEKITQSLTSEMKVAVTEGTLSLSDETQRDAHRTRAPGDWAKARTADIQQREKETF